jgi:type I restriction enzyme, R subunit
MDHRTYTILVLRYKELSLPTSDNPPSGEDLPYDLVGYITTINMDDIDADYMNSRFDKYRKALSSVILRRRRPSAYILT